MILTVVAALISGLLTAAVFGLTVNRAALRSTVRQIQGHFLEFRLFFDNPRLIWHAQKALVRANLRLLRIVLPPILILALPMAWLFVQLDRGPLQAGKATVVTAQFDRIPEQITLEAPPEIVVETPPVRITAERQVVWRVRPLRVTGRAKFRISPNSNVVSLKVDYPRTSRWWMVWFFSISTVVTLIASQSRILTKR